MEKRDLAQKNFHEFTEKNQEQVRMRLTDAVFARMVVDVRSMPDTMPPEHKAESYRPQFARSYGGGGGGDNSLSWDRKEDEDDRRFAYRCMMQANDLQKMSQS